MKKKIPSILALFLIMVVAAWMMIDYSINSVKSNFYKNGFITLSADSVNYLFDTGANITTLYSDTVPESFSFLTCSEIVDILGNKYAGKKYFSFFSGIGPVEGNWLVVLLMSKQYGMSNMNGIIGTDIIDRSDWLIDFKSCHISNDFPSIAGEPDMVIYYRKQKGLYYAEVSIGGTCFSDLLIDTGYDRSDFLLKKEEIGMLPNCSFIRTDSCFGFTDRGDIIHVYGMEDCHIGSNTFNNVTFVESHLRRLIGLPFFKRFSCILFDTQNQKINCFF